MLTYSVDWNLINTPYFQMFGYNMFGRLLQYIPQNHYSFSAYVSF